MSRPHINANDLVGKRFGHCTVIGYDEEQAKERPCSTHRWIMYKCLCDCGKNFWVGRYALTEGIVTQCEAHKNDRIIYKNYTKRKSSNKSGYIGVWAAPTGVFHATCQWQGKQYFLGRFHTAEAAAEAREKFMTEHEIIRNLKARLLEEE